MIQAIPKVKINDRATWIEEPVIAVSADNLRIYSRTIREAAYFQNKQIILLSVIPDDLDLDYYTILEELAQKGIDLRRFILTTADCSCYNDQPAWCDDELEELFLENEELFRKFKPQIGILKGYDAPSYNKTRKSLSAHVTSYLLYISGEARSNPRYFNLQSFITKMFPDGLEKPVYLHGCPPKQLQSLSALPFTVQGIITATHISRAIFHGNPHYQRATSILIEWKKYSQAVSAINQTRNQRGSSSSSQKEQKSKDLIS